MISISSIWRSKSQIAAQDAEVHQYFSTSRIVQSDGKCPGFLKDNQEIIS